MHSDNEGHGLATYVSDMLALERHVRVPFETQNHDADFGRYSEAAALESRLSATADSHIAELKNVLESLGGHEASGIKSAVAQIEGVVAGAIDKARKTKVSKALRDDYTALALCCAGYSALLATANGMADGAVAGTASRMLQDYASMVMAIGNALPAVVVEELAATGLDVDPSTAQTSRQQIQQSWTAAGADTRADAPRTTRDVLGATPQSIV
jgi:ferritin-like metal-binding protein YciE